MRSAAQYLKQLRDLSPKTRGGWKLTTFSNPDENYEAIKIRKSLAVLDNEDIYETISSECSKDLDERTNFNKLINLLSSSLHDDIKDCVERKYYGQLASTKLGILSTGTVDAYCAHKDIFGEKLDGPIICINEGIYFSLNLIASSLVMESLTGKLSKYKKDGSEAYMSAITLYIEPNINYIDLMFNRVGDARVEGEINSYQALVSMLIMQFIALHEFGHIINNDLELMDEYSMHIATGVAKDPTTLDNLKKHHQAEFKADEFALMGICSRSENEVSKWANFYSIYLYFLWLESVEDFKGTPLCDYHPAPKERANKLKDVMIREVGNEKLYIHHLQWLEDKVNQWYRK